MYHPETGWYMPEYLLPEGKSEQLRYKDIAGMEEALHFIRQSPYACALYDAEEGIRGFTDISVQKVEPAQLSSCYIIPFG